MKEFKTHLPFKWYEQLANNKAGWAGNGRFLDLLIPALRLIEDEDVIIFIGATSFNYSTWVSSGQIQKNLDANDIAIVREYVRRRLETIKVEEKEKEVKIEIERVAQQQDWYTELKDSPYLGQVVSAYIEKEYASYIRDDSKYGTFSLIFQVRLDNIRAIEKREREARESILAARAALQKDPSYTGIQPKADPTDQAQEDMYSNFSVSMFEAEIDRICQESLQAQLAGDRERSAFLSKKAAELSDREQALKKKIAHAKTATGINTMFDWNRYKYHI